MKKQWAILGIGFVIIIVLGVVLFSTRGTTSSQTGQNTPTVMPTAMQEATTDLGTFKGTLPCADCSGLETEISFTKKVANSAEGTYEMTET